MANVSVALITDVCFWQENGGGQARIGALVAYLNQHVELVILYAGSVRPTDEAMLTARFGPLGIEYLSLDEPVTPAACGQQVQAYLMANPVGVCLFMYTASTFLLDYLPPGIPTILDTLDLMSNRKQSYEQFKAPYTTLDVSEADELDLLSRYDYVLLIQENDYRQVRPALGKKALLAPHPACFPRVPIREQATRIGYIAGNSEPNLDGIVWFIREVWPTIRRAGLTLDIYGEVGGLLTHNSPSGPLQAQLPKLEATFPGVTAFYQSRILDLTAYPDIVLHDYVPSRDAIYNQIDVVVNPVRFGSGLKIKNMEALGYGLPLLTTTHGAAGLEPHVGQALLVADEPTHFAQQLNQLLDSYPLRRSLGEAAYELARTQFSPDACFGPLLTAIQTLHYNSQHA